MNIQPYYLTDLDAVQNIGLDERSKYLRSLIFRAVLNGGRGHVGSALSLVETIRVLYESILTFDPKTQNFLRGTVICYQKAMDV